MKHKDFCIFILTHGRPDKLITLTTLKRLNCQYPIYFLIDNEDKRAEEYYDTLGRDRVIMFDKKAISDTTDEGDNFEDRRTITHVRNFSFIAAKQLGYKYFIQLDDDYTTFGFNRKLNGDIVFTVSKNIDPVFDAFIDFYKASPFASIAFSQGGDFIGGVNSNNHKQSIKRKAMNSFFCSVDRPFKFIGRLNEDVNTYCSLGLKGVLFGTVMSYRLKQKTTQLSAGGMTEAYLKYGTYVKSFYTVMYCPSFVKISMIGNTRETMRIHHFIQWKYAVPYIISPDYKK